MILDTHTKVVLKTAIDNLNKKQQVISSNLANIDTPLYKAKTTNFDSLMNNVLKKENYQYEKNFIQTHEKHFSLKDDFEKNNLDFEILQKNNYLVQNDENDVDLDIENMEMSKTNMLLNASISAYNKEGSLFNKVLTSFSKLN